MQVLRAPKKKRINCRYTLFYIYNMKKEINNQKEKEKVESLVPRQLLL